VLEAFLRGRRLGREALRRADVRPVRQHRRVGGGRGARRRRQCARLRARHPRADERQLR
jgi:hypothetical protein